MCDGQDGRCTMAPTPHFFWPKYFFYIFRFYMFFKFDDNLFLFAGVIRWNKVMKSIFLS